MKYCSSLVIKSFRKNEVKLLSRFIYKLKLRIFGKIVHSLLIIKFRLLFKITLILLSTNTVLVDLYKTLLFEILNTNYFYIDSYGYLLSLYYNINYSYSSSLSLNLFYNYIYDLLTLNLILEYISRIKIKSFSHMPNKRKVFTVLRGPHIDKKAREQFSLTSYRKFMYDEFDILYNIIKYTELLDSGNYQLIYKKLTRLN